MVNVPSDRLAAGQARKCSVQATRRPVTKAGMREPDVVQTISYKSSESKRTYGKDMTDKPYVVYVDDKFYYMNEEERCGSGEYATLEEAVSKCQRIVDEFLEDAYKPGMSSKELYDHGNRAAARSRSSELNIQISLRYGIGKTDVNE
jgi:hypothetical protein